MNNLILEMKKITDEAKDNNLSFTLTRNQLKEYLQYFVLDFIYNSQFKDLIFYGGSCLRILHDLPRMSEDLDFEADESINFNALAKGLRNYFQKDLKLKEKFSFKKEKGINRIFLNFPVMHELGLSPHKEETLRIKVEIRPEPKNYFKKLKPTFTPKSKYGKSFVIKHYDLPTLFASKLAAILDRPKKGFFVGKQEEEINFKGRDFFDLIWYMEKSVLPNEKMLEANNIDNSVEEVFDKISIFISQTNLASGLKKDLEDLFISQNFVENFVENFELTFYNLKKERYNSKKIKKLNKIIIHTDFSTDIHFFKFDYLCENGIKIFFLFKASYEFIHDSKINANIQLIPEYVNKIDFRISGSVKEKEYFKKYIALFLSKINDYLKRHHNKIYFNKWESKLIRINKNNFNPEKEIAFPLSQELISNKKITLEILSL